MLALRAPPSTWVLHVRVSPPSARGALCCWRAGSPLAPGGQLPRQWAGEQGAWEMGSGREGEAGRFPRRLSCGLGSGYVALGRLPSGESGEVSPGAQSSEATVWHLELGDGHLSCDHTVSLSVQPARLCPLPSW